ncbi:MAG: AraC family ligand binding domain-containing protein [Oscillospiraceae bacterium]
MQYKIDIGKAGLEGETLVQDITDSYIWEKNRKILTRGELGDSGLEMLGHEISTRSDSPLLEHQHRGFLELVYVVSGSQAYRINERDYVASGNSVFLAQADVVHSSGDTPHGRHEIYWLRIPGTLKGSLLGLSKPDSRFLHRSLIKLGSGIYKLRENRAPLLAQAFDRFACGKELDRIFACALLTQFLCRLVQEGPQPRIDNSIIRVLEFVQANVTQPIALEQPPGFAGCRCRASNNSLRSR